MTGNADRNEDGFGPLVDVDWLLGHLDDPDLRLLDARYFLPSEPEDARESYRSGHLPGAVHADIDALSAESELPHMLPSPERFAQAVAALGVGADSTVVVYDSRLALFSAARIWWLFRMAGFARIAILDGGLPAWTARGLPLEQGDALPGITAAVFVPGPALESVCDSSAVLRMSREAPGQIVDARGEARFQGIAPEPRPGLRSGHIPGSVNLPVPAFTGSDGRLLPPAALRALFLERGVDLDRPLITSCGSGVTAAVAYLAARHAGAETVSLYDGSWSEWGDAARGFPIESPGNA